MTTRRFCDFCGGECTAQPANGSRNGEAWLSDQSHVRRGLRVTVEVAITDAITDICTACVFSAVHQIDPTPREDDR